MKQASVKNALMESSKFSTAYMKLKSKIHEDDRFWVVDDLRYLEDVDSVILHPEYKVRYGNEMWLVFAETKDLESFGFVIMEKEEYEEDEEDWENEDN